MNVALSPRTQQLLEHQLKSGAYGSPDAVIQAALEALDQLANLDSETLDAVDRAEDQIDRGELHDWRNVRDELRSAFDRK